LESSDPFFFIKTGLSRGQAELARGKTYDILRGTSDSRGIMDELIMEHQ
jgi:hypothetical protein